MLSLTVVVASASIAPAIPVIAQADEKVVILFKAQMV